jgi:predicted dienelactone hydrolase
MKWAYGVLAAIVALTIGLVGVAYWTALSAERRVGFQISRVTEANGKPFAIGVWYPTDARTWPTSLIGITLMNVARDSPIAGRDLPLVVISHGNGGGLQSHADLALALASAGYVVAAPMHAGDNFADQSAAGAAALYSNRTRQLRAAVDHMLTQWQGRDRIDPERVGAFGFSAGGFTVLAAAGAQPDMRLIAKHCAQAPEFVCDVLRHFNSALLNPDSAATESMQTTPGLRAAVLAAPGLGFTMTPTGLAGMQVPVQLWSGEKDEQVPYATNAKLIQEALGPKVEFHSVPGAGHASFLAPCGLIRPASVCSDPGGFDRMSFHSTMNDEVLKFFEQHLRRR